MRQVIVIAATLVLSGCAFWNQKAIPVDPDNGAWTRCPSGGYCHASDSVCGREGYACGPTECCFVGDTTFGVKNKQRWLPIEERAK